MRRAAHVFIAIAIFGARAAWSKPSTPIATATSTPGATATSTPGAAGSVGGCVESIPQGVERPTLIDHFPLRGYSGYAATLVVTVEHGKG